MKDEKLKSRSPINYNRYLTHRITELLTVFLRLYE